MTKYLITFPSGAMDHVPEEEMPEVATAARAVCQEAIAAGVLVLAGGLAEQPASLVTPGGAVTSGPGPDAVSGVRIVDVPSLDEALRWAAKVAAACRCTQEVREVAHDPELELTPAVRLRRVEDADLDVFFDHQADPLAVEMAAFPARDKDAFAAHWAKVRADDANVVRTIVAGGAVAGHIGSWQDKGQQLLGYWVGREFWGRGIATQALALLVDEVSVRPLYAHVAAHNVGSIRVLRKCGFRRDRGQEALAPAPDDGIEELVFVLTG
jgi:RimJ/RimL family protein N-acetyltransferase